MLRILTAFILVLTTTSAHAQQPVESYAVTLTTTDWNVILSALGERPAKDVFGTIAKVQQQIAEAQQKAKLPPLPPPKPQE